MRRPFHLKIWALLVWLVIWQIAAMAVDLPIFFVTPLAVLQKFISLAATLAFWKAGAYTLARIVAGFLLAAVSAVLLAVLSARFRILEQFLAPPLLAIRSVPVVSFIILALICFSSKHLSILISFLMVLPILYANTLQGIRAADAQLLEMANVFSIGAFRKVRYIYLPQVFPYFRAACTSAMGIAWKAGTAAEVIGMPTGSIGERLQEAKTYLMTTDLFAWTVLIVLFSLVTEKVGLYLLDQGLKVSQRMGKAKDMAEVTSTSEATSTAITVKHVSKSYGDNQVLLDFNADFPAGKVSVIMAPSGAGKTTLLRLLMGVEKADGGEIRYELVDAPDAHGCHRIAALFQEDRLLLHLPARENIRLTNPKLSEEELQEGLKKTGLLSDTHPGEPVKEYSGGMQRRVALLRALLSDADVLFLDEAFKGLDAETKEFVMAYTKEKVQGRTVILVTHDEAEAKYFSENICRMGV